MVINFIGLNNLPEFTPCHSTSLIDCIYANVLSMSSRNRSDYLEADTSDEEQSNHSVDDFEDSRTTNLVSRSSKRQKVDHSLDGDDGDVTHDEEADNIGSISAAERVDSRIIANDSPNIEKKSSSSANAQLKPLSASQLEASQRKIRKTGVIYISRVPPFMRPSTLKHLLMPYGTINRLFLTPEPAASYARRLKGGGNKKRSFTDGWVEFASKKQAKICAETLNGEIIGGKKGGWYHDDLWNIKYLRGFKWADLMEQVQGEERMREGRMRAELQKEMRERKLFLANAERSKIENGMEAKRRQKEVRSLGSGQEERAVIGVAQEPADEENGKRKRHERTFRQNEVMMKDIDIKSNLDQPEHVRRVLNKIF